ncbi:hypothetical protein WR25_22584 [Diploscapter pachys]|uniref:G-protein coupled receptors family 1 profile domain-containing protein n=1 Tax=Diploscapter pachys TaxID=2018661 RepID=A0A2A2KJP1_9BILA|nr:hypothetical protein WR25_22584 [Diploscapter pachys]
MPNDTSCMNLNDELWLFRGDYTTRTPVVALFGFLYSIIIICGVIGNTCVVLAITRNKALQTVPNLFILSLSCSDIVVCCISATITPITAFRKDWIFGPALCRIAPFFAGLSLCFSTFTLTAISIDRYMLICFPMKKPLSHKQAGYVIAFICLFCGSIVSPVIFKQKLGTFGNFCGLYCTEDWSGNEYQRRIYGSVLLFIQFLIPLIIIGFSYTLISLRIGQSMILKNAKNKKNNSNSSDGCENYLTDQQKIAIRRKQRANRMFIAMVIAFVVSWLPSLTYNLLRDYELLPDSVTSQEFLVGVATHCTAMTSTVWNPLLYAALNPQLRAAFIELIPGSIRQKLHLEQEKSYPLLNGNNLTGTELTQAGRANKYGSTSIQVGPCKRADMQIMQSSCKRVLFLFLFPSFRTDFQSVEFFFSFSLSS